MRVVFIGGMSGETEFLDIQEGVRLGDFIAQKTGSRDFQTMRVSLNGKQVPPETVLSSGDQVSATMYKNIAAGG